VLSPEGELLLSYAQRLFRLADEAEKRIAQRPADGRVRIGSLESTAGSRLAPILSRFHRCIRRGGGTRHRHHRRAGAAGANFEIEAAFVSEPFTRRACRR
jgi:DNA-binding transcriptional LysR family regulator